MNTLRLLVCLVPVSAMACLFSGAAWALQAQDCVPGNDTSTIAIRMTFAYSRQFQANVELDESPAGCTLKAIISSLDANDGKQLDIRSRDGDVTIRCVSSDRGSACTLRLTQSAHVLISPIEAAFITTGLVPSDFTGLDVLLRNPNWTIPLSLDDKKGTTFDLTMGYDSMTGGQTFSVGGRTVPHAD